jgi:hypothetical protein
MPKGPFRNYFTRTNVYVNEGATVMVTKVVDDAGAAAPPASRTGRKTENMKETNTYVETPVVLQEREPEIDSGKRRMPDNLRKFLLRVQGGKFYLPAAYRIVWFRDECPDWGVETQLIEGGQEAGFATVQARIYNAEGRVIASGIKTETRQDFPAGWVEKAETGSIARALAVAGFGTQFAPELDDDGDRPADSPQGRPSSMRSYGDGARGGDGFARDDREGRNGGGTKAAASNGVRAVSPTEVWEGPGQCPNCHAPEGKRHGKPCVA